MNGGEQFSTVAPDTDRTEPRNRNDNGGPLVSEDTVATPTGESSDLRLQLTQKEKELLEIKRRLWATKAVLLQKENELNKIMGTVGWRLLSHYGPVKYRYVLPMVNRLRNFLRRGPGANAAGAATAPAEEHDPAEPAGGAYLDWTARCEQFRYERESARRRVEGLGYRPVISIIVPVYNPPLDLLKKAIESVRSQFYPGWQLCLCDDASTDPEIRGVLKEYADADERIKVVFAEKNGGIARASNLALGLATGEFVGLLDDDDELTPDALLEVVTTLQEDGADLIYSDEDKLDAEGARCDPFLKPAWSPDLLLSCNYVCHFGVYRKKLVDEIGGFREGFDGSQDYDLVLRFTEKTDRIAHIPKILYHWRKRPGSAASSLEAKPYAYEASCKALTDALTRRGIQATAERLAARGFHRVKRSVLDAGKVSIIVPTRDRLGLLSRCIASIEAKTEYEDYEILIVDNDSCEPATIDYLQATKHRVLRDLGPFNFSRLNNLAASAAGGRYLVLLNNDTEIISPEWLTAMMEQAQRPEVGAVGAKLLYPDGLIQHAGVIVGLGGVGNHSQRFIDGQGGGYFNFPNLIMNYSAVTAACMMVRRELYEAMGGLNDKDLAVAFNDVDFCLRLRQAGYLIVFTPYSLVYHHESASRGYRVNMREAFYMMDNWRDQLAEDPYYNPSLSRDGEGFTVDLSKPEALSCVYQQEASNEAVPVTEERCLGQYFFSATENLSAIGIYFATYRQKCAGTVRFHLRETHLPAGPDLVFCEVNASQIQDNSFFTFAFQPIRNSAGKTFYFFVEYEPHREAQPLSIWKASITNEIIGPHYAGHNSASGTLCFKVYCHVQSRRARVMSAGLTAQAPTWAATEGRP